MTLRQRQCNRVRVVQLAGELRNDNDLGSLKTALVEVGRQAGGKMILNLEKVHSISYVGIGILVERLRRLRAMNGDMKLVGLQGEIAELFRMAGAASCFEVYESESAALERFAEAS